MVKLAAARANFETGGFSKEILTAIEKACQEIIDGKLHDQFQLDVLQGGAGTSTNMNANEVIANRGLELMGTKKGEYKFLDPHDHVNRSQSTNDSYPDVDAHRHGARQRTDRRGVQGADRRVQSEGPGVQGHRSRWDGRSCRMPSR